MMNHYSAFLRSCNIKSTNSSSATNNNENDENSSIKNILLKHLSKGGQQVSTTSNASKGLTRGILGELGNTAISNKPTVSVFVRSKCVQQENLNNIVEKNVRVTAVSLVNPIPSVTDQFEDIALDDEMNISSTFNVLSEVPAEFDCDSGDGHSITTASEYVVDICKYWRDLEQQTAIRPNFLVNRAEGTASSQNRAVLIDWLYQVHDRFKLLSDTFHMAIQLIDRYLQAVDVSKHELQLIGSTALLMACKYEEMTIPGMNDFVYVSDSAFSKEEMKEMERQMISTLSFDLGRPLSINYLRRYSKIVQANDIEHTLGKYLLDLTFTDHSFSHFFPSYIAACASFLSRYLFVNKRVSSTTEVASIIESLWPMKFMFYHTNYTFEQLRPGIEKLGQLLIAQETSKLRSVQKKFSQSNLFSIAQHSCCKSAYVQLALARLSQ